MARDLLMLSQRLMLILTMATTYTVTEVTEVTMVMVTPTVTVTTARGPLMPSPPSLLEPARCSLPPLLSSTTLLPSLSHTPIPSPMLGTPPIHWPIMVSPSLLLLLLLQLLMRPSLLRGRRERLTPRSS